MTTTYPFTEEDAKQAFKEWGCNCGPTALAFALRVRLDQVRRHIPEFDRKRYTSPTMMKAALGSMVVEYAPVAQPTPLTMFGDRNALVRVQWTGPWTKPGSNPRWAYTHTHWIATWLEISQRNESTLARMVFDCNGGIRSFDSWKREIVPLLTDYPRADGGWEPTHVWRLKLRFDEPSI